MTETIIVALIGFAGTLAGAFLGVLSSTKLITYRIEQLEKKVDEYNNIEALIPVLEEQMKVANHRIADLEHIVQKEEAV